MSTKQEPGPFDGMAKAEPDEPVFTLRAHDPLAADLVRLWVERRREAIRADNLPAAKEALELVQCREAEEIAWKMDEWRVGEYATPDEVEPDEPAPRYSGHTSSAEELASKAQYDAIKGASTKLHNAVAEVTGAAEELLKPHGFPHERAVIHAVAHRLKAVAEHIAPKRASYYAGQPLPEPIPLEPLTLSGGELNHLVAEHIA